MMTTDPAEPLRSSNRPGLHRWLRYFSLGLISRVVVVLLGCVFADRADLTSQHKVAQQGRAVMNRQEMLARSSRVVEPWYRWDGVWYAEISRDGYSYTPGMMSNVAFLPALPVIMAGGAKMGLDRYWVGLLVPNLAFAAGLAWFALAALKATGDLGTMRRSCLLLVVYPWSFFFSAPYQESLGFCLSACGLWAWLSWRPGVSALATGLASTARISSVALGAGVMVEWLWDLLRRRPMRPWAWAWAWGVALSSLVGVGLYYVYLYRHFGDATLSLKSHEAWGRKSASLPNFLVSAESAIFILRQGSRRKPLLLLGFLIWICHRPILRAISAISPVVARVVAKAAPFLLMAGVAMVVGLGFRERRELILNANFIKYCDILCACCFIALGIRAWIRRGPFWACLTLIPVALALATGSLQSLSRVVLASFPAFLEAGEVFKDRVSMIAIVILMIAMQAVLINNYVNWYFCG